MIFTLLERLMIPGLLPREGSFLDMASADNLLKAVRFSPEEMSRARDPEGLNLRQNDRGGMDWENEFVEDYSLVCDLGIDQAALLKKVLEKLDAEQQLPRDALSLYQKIVVEGLSADTKKLPELVKEAEETKKPVSIFEKAPEDE